MNYLVRVSGHDLNLPIGDCEKPGYKHFVSAERDISTDVEPSKLLLPYLKTLISSVRNLDTAIDPPDCVNLLYKNPGDILNLDLLELASANSFDIFCSCYPVLQQERFAYRNRRLLRGPEPLRNEKVADIFPGRPVSISLDYIGSSGVELVRRSDYDAVDEWCKHCYAQEAESLRKDMAPYLNIEKISTIPLRFLQIVHAIATSRRHPTSEALLEMLEENENYGICYDMLQEAGVAQDADWLVEQNILRSRSEHYGISLDLVRHDMAL